jgi:hypothetical protein
LLKYPWFDLRAMLIALSVGAVLLLAVLPAFAGPWDRLALVAAQVAADSQQSTGVGTLVYQKPAKGRYGQDGVACTYNVDGQQVTIFKASYCPLTVQF